MRIGVDVGGTNLRVGVVIQNKVVFESRYQAEFSEYCHIHSSQDATQFVISSLEEAIRDVSTRYPGIEAIGIGFPGFVSPETGHVLQSPNLPGLLDVDISAPLSALLNVPVIIENDALAAAYGEYVCAPNPSGSLIYIGLGTGVGGGMIIGGKPFPGNHGVAMEVGHLIIEPGGRHCGCGNFGCLERYASASGVALTYTELTGSKDKSTAQIAELANLGDASARQAFERAGQALAQGLAHVLKVVDIPSVVIGGGLSASWNLIENSFFEHLDEDLIPALRNRISVSISTSGDQAGIIGAAALAG